MTSPEQSDWEVRRLAQIAEYGTYVAVAPIDVSGGIRAYNVGDPVPISNVVEHGYLEQGLVEKVASAPKAPKQVSTPRADASAKPAAGAGN